MKPQVILFALLRAQAALSDEGSPAVLPDCASPCKTNLRAGASKLSECVRSRCGAPLEMEEEGENVARSPNACVARCLKLRFGPARQEQCIKDCDQNEEDGGRSASDAETAKYGAEEEEEDRGENDAQSPNACVARCRKLRFGRARQKQCIKDCDRDEEDGDRSVPDAETAKYDTEEEGEDIGENDAQSPNACVARCRKLRFGPARQKQCIKDCDRDEEDSGRSVPDAETAEYDAEEEGEDIGENDVQSPNACVARCRKLRFGRARQEQCIKDCDRDEEDGGRSVPDAETAKYDAEEEGEDIGENDAQSPNACVARCLKLRFGRARQEQCIKDCDRDEEDGGRSVPDAETAEYDTEDEGEDIGENNAQSPNACVARCLKLRFGPARQEQCLKNCKTDEDNGTLVVKGSNPDSKVANLDAEEEEGDVGEKVAQSPNACVARCLRLRFGATRQKQCIADCAQEGVPSRESISDDVGDEQAYAATA